MGTFMASRVTPKPDDAHYRCTGCDTVKPASGFYARRRANGEPARVARCKECVKAKTRANHELADLDRKRERNERWAAANPEKVKTAQQRWNERNAHRFRELQREGNLRRKYGISIEDYDRMWESQGGACGVCRAPGDRAVPHSLQVDHCHETGTVRMLLCPGCNAALGRIGDDPDRLMALAAYVLRFRNVLEQVG